MNTEALQELLEQLQQTGLPRKPKPPCTPYNTGFVPLEISTPNDSETLCHWDMEVFQNKNRVVYQIPIRVNVLQFDFIPNIIFCSPSCAKAYLLHEIPEPLRSVYHALFDQYIGTMFKITTGTVPKAPSRQLLPRFTKQVYQTIDEFRGTGIRNNQSDVLYALNAPSMIHERAFGICSYGESTIDSIASKKTFTQTETIPIPVPSYILPLSPPSVIIPPILPEQLPEKRKTTTSTIPKPKRQRKSSVIPEPTTPAIGFQF